VVKLDPVREKFAQAFHATGNASEAFRRANPRSKKWKPEALHPKASNMLAEDKVQARLSELQAASAERHMITIETLTEMLKDDRMLARENAQSSAAVRAVEVMARLHGLLVEKQEHTGKDGTPLTPVINVTVSGDAGAKS